MSVNENQEVSFPYFSFSSLLTCRSSSDTITKQVECRFLIGLRIVLVVAILMAFGRLKPHVQPSLFLTFFRRLPVTRIWPFAPMQLSGLDSESSVSVNMPSIEHQDLLIELYFTYVHPELPVLNKSRFLSLYTARSV